MIKSTMGLITNANAGYTFERELCGPERVENRLYLDGPAEASPGT